MTRSNRLTLLAVIAGLTLPLAVQAHPGHAPDAGFLAGALHPFSGLDHLIGIVFAGLLLGVLPQRLRWRVCAGFLVLIALTHLLWHAPDEAGGAFITGLLLASAALIAAGMAAIRMAARRLTAAARRSRT